MDNKNVLVVGGSGFIGYHLIKLLLKKGFKITSISKKKPKKKRILKRVNYLQVDITKIKKMSKIKKNFNYIINLGGNIDHSNKKITYNTHYKGIVNLYNYFKNSKIKSFIQIGSSLEYGGINSPQNEYDKEKAPKSVYGRSKLLSTKFLLNKYKSNFFPVVVIRGYQVYGPRQDANRLVSNVIVNCLKKNTFPCSAGNQKRDFLYVDDFVLGIYKTLKAKKIIGNIINLGYGKAYKVKKIILLLKNLIKKGNPVFNKIKLRKDESEILFPNIKKAKVLIGWKPKTQLLAGLKKTIYDYKKQFYESSYLSRW